LNDIGTCLLQINATNGDADNSSIDENLRKAFLCNICHDIFPLNWKSDIKDISGNYYRIRFALYDYIKDNKFTCVNSASYIENVDYFVKGKDFYELYFKLTPEESSKIFSERYTYEYDSTLSVALSRLSEQIPLKLEYYNLFSKINIDKILSCDETNNIALDGKKPKEPAYIIDIVDNKGNEKKAYIKKNNISKTGQKEQIHNILQWNKDHL